MTADLAAAAAVAGDEVAVIAERIEAALEHSGRRGLSPARAARAARCTTAQARDALVYLVAHQLAHTDRSWSHIQAGRPA